MAEKRQHKGPWTHRFLVRLFTIILAVLLYWTLDFVINDIGTWPGPVLSEVEQRLLDQGLVKQEVDLQQEITGAGRKIRERKTRQSILRDSTSNSQRTMNQLLDIRRLGLRKDVAPSKEEQKALAGAEKLFLDNQKQYQGLNEEIARLNEELRDLQGRQRKLNQTLRQKRVPVHAEFNTLLEHHHLKVAAIKLAVLIPLLVVVVVLFWKKRTSIYVSLIYAFGIALVLKVGLVMHEYFPTRHFKYVLILISLAIAIRILMALLQTIARPGKEWLLKQYREAYETFFCPICDYPIRRGPLKYLFWTRGTIKKRAFPPPATSDADESYTCPMCSTKLYEECDQCHAVRHSLLPSCDKCGAEKSLAEVGQPAE